MVTGLLNTYSAHEAIAEAKDEIFRYKQWLKLNVGNYFQACKQTSSPAAHYVTVEPTM